MAIEFLRTPDDRFRDLPDWPYAPRYVEIPDAGGGSLRMHFVDEGPAEGAPILCLHGQPTWSYLYRKMIPIFVAAGRRVVAPDLVGFGRSDKPVRSDDYGYARHVAWLRAFVEALDLREIELICQDWGGLLGLRLVAECSDFAPEAVLRALCPGLSQAEVAAYAAPFPDERHRAGARRFPALVPILPDDPSIPANRRAWASLARFEKPFLAAFTDRDPVTTGQHVRFQQEIPGAAGQPHITIRGAGHFVQEEAGPELAHVALEFFGAHRPRAAD